MPTDLPLSTVILTIVQRTPSWVWLILAAITLIGIVQLRDRVVTRGRLLGAPVSFSGYSLVGAMQIFGARPAVVAAWLCGMAMSLTANQRLRRPRGARPEGDGRYTVRGSLAPLLTMWSVFALRYAVAVGLVLHPEWMQMSAFSLALPLAFGTLSGVLLARALHVLQSANAPRLATA